MVRKKKKSLNTLVKANGLATADAPLPADIRSILLPSPVAVSLHTGANATLDLDLGALTHNLLHAPDSYAQLKALQLFRSHLKLVVAAAPAIRELDAVAQADLWSFASTALRFAFRLYIAKPVRLMRKTILPILDALLSYDAAFPHLASPSLSDVLADEVESFLQVATATDADATSEALDVIDQLLGLAECPHIAEMLWLLHPLGHPGLASLLAFCATQLRVLSAPIAAYAATTTTDDDDDVMQSSEVIHASERCQNLLKTLILLASVQQKTATRVVLFSTTTAIGSPRSLHATLEAMVQQCVIVLNSPVVAKDLLTQVGLVTALLLKLHYHGNDFAGDMLAWVFPSSAGVTGWLRCLDLSAFTPLSRLALYRGLFNAIDDAAFQRPFRSSNVLQVAFDTVLRSCVGAPTLNTRLYAFQVLEMFLRRTIALAQRTSADVLTPASVLNVLDVVLLNWEHPSKRINQFMTPMFTHLVALLDLKASAGLDKWTAIITRVLAQPEESRSRYLATTVLLPKVTAKGLLASHQGFLASVLVAVANKDVSAAAACLFVQVVDDLKCTTEDAAMWAGLWVPYLVHALLSNDAGSRLRVATYVLPILIKSDAASVPPLLAALRAQPASDTRLWSMLELVKCARKSVASPPTLTLDEVHVGLVHADGEIRMAAYDMVCASLKTTALPSPSDLQLVQLFFIASAKSIAPSLRMKSIIGLKAMLLRIRDGMRKSCRRDAATTDDVAHQFPRWVADLVVACVYPGATPQRVTMGLEILQLYLQIFDGTPFLFPAVTKALFNALISSWDKVRALAYSILETFPSPLPGYDDAVNLQSLYRWALTLASSPRQRETDAGALFLRLLAKQSALLVQFGIVPKSQIVGASVQQALVDHLVSILASRLAVVRANADVSEPPLIHGLLLSIRFLLDDAQVTLPTWQTTLSATFECLWESMQLALSVVGDATSGIGAASLDDTFDVANEVLTSEQLRAKAVDSRGHVVLDEDDTDPDTEQRAVVGSWLAAREAGAAMDTLVRLALPLATVTDDALLTSLHKAGATLLNALFELKHGGAVATVSVAFEGICRSLLHHSERHRHLGTWPAKWCDTLLSRLEHAEQAFILRRSAGFASSFVALLRSEPRNAAATMLPKVLSVLLRLGGRANAIDKSRVHALNILKLLAQDAVLAEDMAAHVPSMLRLAIDGFESTSWAVRNSSMMLFAAATQRAIGDKQVADGAAPNGVSSTDVFSRCTGVDTFLADHVGAMTNSALYPLLLLMSRLRPGDGATTSVLPLSTFVPMVTACASQSHIFHRRIAAHALAAIVRTQDIADVIASLLPSLTQWIPRRTSHNAMHGTLLQLLALLDRAADDKAKKLVSASAFAALLAPIVEACTALLPSALALKCMTNKGTFLQLVSSVLQHAPDAKLTQSMWDACIVLYKDDVPRHRSPGLDIVHQAVAAFVVSYVVAHPVHADVVRAGLRSSVFELRRSTTTACAAQATAMAPLSLVATLAAQVVVETHPPTLGRQLQLLVTLAPSSLEVWTHVSPALPTLLELSVHAVDATSKAAALQVLALLHATATVSAPPALAETLVCQIQVLSDELQPLVVRLAAARSLHLSKLLAQQSNANLVVDGWLAALVLLQDDEACVREAIRATVAPLVTSAHAAPSDMMVLPYAVAYLAQTFGHVGRLQEAIASYLTTYTALYPRLDECISASDGHAYNVLCDKIFEAESGNYFKEHELLVQLFAQHFVRTGKVRLPTVVADLETCLRRWAAANALHQQAWVGGTTFFPDVFPLFHNALLVVIAQVHAMNETACEGLQALARNVLGSETHNMHPLLCQALTALATGDPSLAPLLFLTPSWASKHQIVA
ncbi:hypothetical protein SDRG_10612 [Saprolegnia diclina VS20]|uniref:Uncharacterized protein n=1 Tax=Saprolegnia diclina (strain VS20) TaxID=1156394 RepID=T0Q1V3_SAPDV|nr:hypothetical protein SDRG_10612 [Saprolegnia diclina VS20]EQC31824.1 hypothetical protein SDRG_10612 [Saprolegnia diclina VS20]|eukprot:XP_008614831.1 hypothetical protein SDRG_10612 [Saprolegnia diclina VS20]